MNNKLILLLTIASTGLTAIQTDCGWGGGAFAGGLVTGAVITSAASNSRSRNQQPQVIVINNQPMRYCDRNPNADACRQPVYQHRQDDCYIYPDAPGCN